MMHQGTESMTHHQTGTEEEVWSKHCSKIHYTRSKAKEGNHQEKITWILRCEPVIIRTNSAAEAKLNK